MDMQKKYENLLKDSLTEYYKSADKEGSEIISDFTHMRGKPRPLGRGWIARMGTVLSNILFHQKYVIL